MKKKKKQDKQQQQQPAKCRTQKVTKKTVCSQS